MPELGLPVLPGSVVAAHVSASAEALADGMARVDECVATTGELASVIEQLVAGQQQISVALSRLGVHVRDRGLDDSLAEVLHASAQACGYAAEALAESRPLLQVVLDVTGEDTRL